MKIGFKFGPDPSSDERTELELGAMNILVGPNGAGKSLTLRELAKLCSFRSQYGRLEPTGSEFLAVASLDLNDTRPPVLALRKQRLRETIEALLHEEHEQLNNVFKSSKLVRAYRRRQVVLDDASVDSDDARSEFAQIIDDLKQRLSFAEIAEKLTAEDVLALAPIVTPSASTNRLDSRLRWLSGCSAHSLHKKPENLLMAFMIDRGVFEEVNRRLYESVDFRLAVDASEMSTLRLVTYDDGYGPPPEGAPWSPQVLEWHRNARPLDEHSDGERCFCAIIAQALLCEDDCLLLDEPEVSLHPPLARQLGALVASIAQDSGTTIVAATHSPDFVMGCLSTHYPVNICRLDYRNGKGSAKVLPPERLREMVTRPRLRAANTLGALFHKAAIVCEGPPDRLIYSEINERLLHEEPKSYPKAMADCQFLEHGGMGGIPEPLAMLREAGVRTAAIFDRDLIFDRQIFKRLLAALGDDSQEQEAGLMELDGIAGIFSGSKKTWTPGVDHLDSTARSRFDAWLDKMAARGIFVSERGELEDWLPELELTHLKHKKSKWTPAALDKLGPIEDSPHRPTRGDIWAFMRRVAAWLADTTPTAPSNERSPNSAR